VDLVHHPWIGWRGSGPWWTEAERTRGRNSALLARGRSGSSVLTGGGGGGRARPGGAGGVLNGAQATTKRRCDDKEDRRRLELTARVKEGARELGSEGR
jgi:hypothetical protein